MPSEPVVILTDSPEWHARQLARALEARGRRSLCLGLSACGFTPGGVFLPGLDGRLPAAAIVRTIADGSTEQITFRLGLLHALGEEGVVVVNDARTIERCVDKSMTSFLLARRGLPTPPSWTVESPAAARNLLAASRGELVLKPLFGAEGRGLRRLASGADLPDPAEVDGVYYLQRFVDSRREGRDDWQDRRVLVVGGRAVAAMTRHGRSWTTNVRQGARCAPAPLDDGTAELAVAAAAAVGADYAGIDLIRGRETGWQVLEANSMPAWRGLQSTTDLDIAAAIVAHVLDRLAAAGAPVPAHAPAL